MKEMMEETTLETRGLEQEVTQEAMIVMRRQPPQFRKDTLLEKGKDLKLHYPQSSMETETL